MTDDIRRAAIALYDRFTHDGMDRRLFMGRMVQLAGSVAAAEALIGAIAASPAAAAIVPADDQRLTTRTQTLAGGYKAYVAEPRTRSLKATVLVIHENRGLNDHIRDVARHLALACFRAVAPDLLSPAGGTPAPGGDGSCPKSALRLEVVPASGASGVQYAIVVFTNTAGAACTLSGFPAVSLLLGGKAIGSAATPTATPATTVSLAPGGTAAGRHHGGGVPVQHARGLAQRGDAGEAGLKAGVGGTGLCGHDGAVSRRRALRQ